MWSGKRELKRLSSTLREPRSNIKNGRMIMHIWIIKLLILRVNIRDLNTIFVAEYLF